METVTDGQKKNEYLLIMWIYHKFMLNTMQKLLMSMFSGTLQVLLKY